MVFLAQTDVFYRKLYQLDEIGPTVSTTDLVMVDGATYVVKPSAYEDEAIPIAGTPKLAVDEADRVVNITGSLRYR